MDAAVLVLPVGPPGCGKSHFGDLMFYRDAVLRLDDYRRIMCGDEDDQSANQSAAAVRALFAWERLRHGLTVFADATNARAEYRHQLMLAAREFSAPVIAVWWRLSVDECMHRQCTRQRRVPPEDVARIHGQIEAEADDLRATTHLRIEFDEADNAVIYVSPLGRTLPDLDRWIEYAQLLLDRYQRFTVEPVKVVHEPEPEPEHQP